MPGSARLERLCVDTFTAASCVPVRHSVVTRNVFVADLNCRHVSTTSHQQIGCAGGAFYVGVNVLHMRRRRIDVVYGDRLREDLVEGDARHALVVSRADRRRLVVGVDDARDCVHAVHVGRARRVDDRCTWKHT